MPSTGPNKSSVWQHPFVDVFRYCNLKQWPQGNYTKEGNVKVAMDRTIGHQVITLAGAVPAANYLQLPHDKLDSLALTSRFLYLQVFLKPGETYAIHVDVKTADKNTTRVSISNLFNAQTAKSTQRNIQIAHAGSSDRWTVLALDLPALLAPVTSAAVEETKAMQFCANMLVRGAFTADDGYTQQTLPKDMVLSHALPPSDVNWVWIPDSPPMVPTPFREVSNNIKSSIASQRSGMKPVKHSPASGSAKSKGGAAETVEQQGKQPQAEQAWLKLQHIIGYTGEFTRVMTWLPTSQELVFAAGNTIVVMQSSTGMQRHLLGCANSVCALACSGRTIVSAEAGKLGLIRLWDAPSGQCQALLHGHAGGINCLDVSPDGRFLVAVGLNNHSKQLVILWNIAGLVDGQKAQVLAQYISDYNIKAIKFSPYEEGRLMTCGKDSIRMFRLKLGHLRGMSVHVIPAPGELAKGSWLDTNVFTDIAFETGCGLLQLEERHVYVTSISGAVYQINYGTRTLERVYQLHSAAINCMLVSEGLCVTGSDDKYLRVWPLDFSDFLLEAEHEAPVTAIGLAPDGLTIAVGTENGVIGCLDVPTHQYRTLLRSHTDTINALAVDVHRGEYCTVSSDGTIRGWDIASHAQLFELAAPGEVIQCCAYHPERHELACGFDQGRVRVFDIAETALLQEHKQHRQAVLHVVYLPSGKLLFSLGQDGNLCVYEVGHGYLPIKYLSTSTHDYPACIAVSPDSSLLAAVSRSETSPFASILQFHGTTLEAVRRIESNAAGFTGLQFSQDSSQLLAATADRRLLTYITDGTSSISLSGRQSVAWRTVSKACICFGPGLGHGQLMHERQDMHKVGLDAVALHPLHPLVATAGADRLVKLWPYTQQGMSATAQGQSFIGHSDAVTALAWADATTLISTGAGDAILIWHLTQAALQACAPSSKPDPTARSQPLTPPVQAPQADAALDIAQAFDSLSAAEPGALRQSLEATAGLSQSLADSTAAADPATAACQQSDPAALESLSLPAEGGTDATDGLPASQQQLLAKTAAGQLQQQGEVQCIPPEASLHLERVVGFSGAQHGCCVWLPEVGLLVYASDCFLVLEELASRNQRCLQQHDTGIITSLAVASDSSLIASACLPSDSSQDPTPLAKICLWDVATATCSHVMHHHSCGVQALSFSADAMWLLSAGRDPEQNVVIWDVATGTAVTSGTTSQPVRALAWRPTTTLPAFVTMSKGEVLVWDLEASHLAQRSLRLPAAVLEASLSALAVHDDGSLFLGDEQGAVWRLQVAPNSSHVTCCKSCTLKGKEAVGCLRACSSCLLVGGHEGQLVRYTQQAAGSSIWLEDKALSVSGAVTSMTSHGTALEAVLGTDLGIIWYIDVDSSSQAPLVTGHSQSITCLALPPKPSLSMMASTSQDGILHIWQMPSSPDSWHQVSAVMEFQSQQSCTAAAVVSRGSTPCCAAGYADGCLRLFDLHTASLIWSAHHHSAGTVIMAVHSSPNGRELLTIARDGSMALFSLQDGGLLGEYQEAASGAPQQKAASAAFSQDDKALCAVAYVDRCIIVTSPWHQKPCAVKGQYVCPKTLQVLEPAASEVASVAFGPTGTVLYSSPMLQELIEFDLEHNRVLRNINMQCHATALDVSLCGNAVASADANGSIGLFSYQEGDVTLLQGQCMGCQTLHFSPDNQYVLAGAGSTMAIYSIRG